MHYVVHLSLPSNKSCDFFQLLCICQLSKLSDVVMESTRKPRDILGTLGVRNCGNRNELGYGRYRTTELVAAVHSIQRRNRMHSNRMTQQRTSLLLLSV